MPPIGGPRKGSEVVGPRAARRCQSVGCDAAHSSVEPALAGQLRPRHCVAPYVSDPPATGSTAAALIVACAVFLTFAGGAAASPASAVSRARLAACAGPTGGELKETGALDAVAGRLARGESLHGALGSLRVRPEYATAIHLVGIEDDHGIATAAAGRFCKDLADPRLREIGVARRGGELFIVVVAPLDPPRPADQPAVAREVLKLVNRARAAARQCGSKPYPAAEPLRLSGELSRAAVDYAAMMASSSRLEHRGLDGSVPADRVRRAGYAAELVGENIAGGVPDAAGVVAGWLASPGHCANIMEPRFTEMGLGYALNASSEFQIYWSQLLARPAPRRPS